MPVSKTQIDKIGDRLKGGSHTESDLRLLDDYRRSFGDAYLAVVQTIVECGEFPTGRLAKSTVSIVEKLRRESIRLSQMQDIAGCRVIVLNVMEQEQFVASLRTAFPGASVIDRRDNPSYGYRAVHIIAEISGKPVEIQIRSSLQHLWAELSEKSSDVLDPSIKYGGGPAEWRSFLRESSESVAAYEKFEKRYAEALAAHEKFEKATAELLEHHVPDHDLREMRGRLEDSRRNVVQLRKENSRLLKVNTDLLTGAITWLEERKGQKQ
jgi:ppGpp synthetase/RelA/SpoT-type nucleotidyltranferase